MKNERIAEKLAIKAIEFKNNEDYLKSNELILEILSEYPNYSKSKGLLLLLSGNYYYSKKYWEAIYFSKKIIEIKPNLERAYLRLYLSYFDLDEHEKSFEILFTYLENYSADLFKDTLEELLEGLVKGYGTVYKDRIIHYAKINNVSIPDKLVK